jgi:GT2 family glycosyltransferase
MQPKVQIQVVTHNSKPHLEQLFSGIKKQSDVDYSILIIDNASTDGTKDEILGLRSAEFMPSMLGLRMTVNQENKGFAKAHNQGFETCKSEYVLVLNHDVELQEDCLAQMLSVIQSKERIAAVIPKLYRTLPDNKNSGIIDTFGLSMRPWGQVINRGENKPDKPQNSRIQEVWGASGACVLYRLKALQQVKDEYGIYDERFWMYKEDADLSCRLDNQTWKTILEPNAIAVHARTVQHGNRSSRSNQVKQESIKNHILMLRKNLSLRDWWRMPFIITYELLKLIYILLFERKNLRAYHGAFHHHTKL